MRAVRAGVCTPARGAQRAEGVFPQRWPARCRPVSTPVRAWTGLAVRQALPPCHGRGRGAADPDVARGTEDQQRATGGRRALDSQRQQRRHWWRWAWDTVRGVMRLPPWKAGAAARETGVPQRPPQRCGGQGPRDGPGRCRRLGGLRRAGRWRGEGGWRAPAVKPGGQTLEGPDHLLARVEVGGIAGQGLHPGDNASARQRWDPSCGPPYLPLQ